MAKETTKTEVTEVAVKRYTVIKGRENVLTTNSAKEADRVIKKLMIENEEFIQVQDVMTGVNINYEKTRYQKNYRVKKENKTNIDF